MNTKNFLALAIFMATIGGFFWGCGSNRPASPYQSVALSVSIPTSNEVRSSLLGVASNELLYRVDGPGHIALAHGTVGPFSTSASSGSIDFSATVPALDSLVLSVQLNDASTHQPLAIGAAGLNMVSAPVTDVVVEMGSVTRNCYTLDVPGIGNYQSQDFFTFETDNLIGNSFGQMSDFQFNYGIGSTTPLTISGGSVTIGSSLSFPNIAYLGNGNLVDFDYVPAASAFVTDSGTAKGAPIATGDVFCIGLLSPVTQIGVTVALTGAHAWFQVTALATPGVGIPGTGPSFRYRVNSTVPYYGYERTAPDTANSCSTLW